jgi:hypothetical protein
MIGALDGISDMAKFLAFYGFKEEDLKSHYSGDEDQDWADGEDTNGDGIYQVDEYAGDDVGLDGVSPIEENYNGPDADGTECNHKPDLGVGYAEPNFAWTDVSETDMLGLTTLLFYEAVPHVEPYTGWFRNDKSLWDRMSLVDSLESGATKISNLFVLLSTAIFPLYQGQTEHISISELHSYEDLAGLKSAEHAAPALFQLKKTVQVIYEKDYRFAQPPKMPTLKAIPGDGYVLLLWDSRADRLSREPFLNNKNDFEGYKLYRSTEPDMIDPQIITDGYGTKTLKKPIFECDLKDTRRDFTNYGMQNGAGYYLGSDKGLAYSFKDETIQNGRTYYYAVVAYDYGIRPDELKGTSVAVSDPSYGIAPSENSVVIRKNEFEQIVFVGPNVAVVTPGTPAAGLKVESNFNIEMKDLKGSGKIVPQIVDYQMAKGNKTYKITFAVSHLDSLYKFHPGYGFQYTTSGIRVYDATDGNKLVYEDILMKGDKEQLYPKNLNTVLESFDNGTTDGADDFWHVAVTQPKLTEVFDGIRFGIQMDARTGELDYTKTGWMPGVSPMEIAYIDAKLKCYSWNYDIVFSDQTLYTGRLTSAKATLLTDENGVQLKKENLLFNQNFNFKIVNRDWVDSTGHEVNLDLVVHDLNGNKQFDPLQDRILVGPFNTKNRWDAVIFIINFQQCQTVDDLPKPGDTYAIRFKKPFFNTDTVKVTVNASRSADSKKLKSQMDSIRVVPNPYVATNMMEPSVVNKFLNQRRRLLFTHLPEKCTIKIFTVSGVLVRELHAPEDAVTGYSGYGVTNDGLLHWDMLTKEGLEIAAGMYFYHVKDDKSGEERTGKFAVLK